MTSELSMSSNSPEKLPDSATTKARDTPGEQLPESSPSMNTVSVIAYQGAIVNLGPSSNVVSVSSVSSPAAPAPVPASPPEARSARGSWVLRWGRRMLAVIMGLAAAATAWFTYLMIPGESE